MKKLTYIVSDIDKALAFEWIASNLDKGKFNLNFILLNKSNSQLEIFLKENRVPVRRIKLYHGWKMIFTFFPLWLALMRTRPEIIHTHLRYASLIGLTAGYFSGIKSRIHTRHHAASNHTYYPHAVKHDKWVSRLSTKVVSISDVVTDVLVNWEGVPKDKVIKIPHGFDLNLFYHPDPIKVEILRQKYIPKVKGPVIGMISRYMHLKGVEYCIEAFKTIREQYPDAHLILANAAGPASKMIKNHLKKLPTDSFTEIIFEPDIAPLYQLFDIFIHIPISKYSEAFGQTYIEALASGIPSVFTHSGIACEIAKHKKNAWIVDYETSQPIYDGVANILEDKNLRESIITQGKESTKSFSLNIFIAKLENLYEQK